MLELNNVPCREVTAALVYEQSGGLLPGRRRHLRGATLGPCSATTQVGPLSACVLRLTSSYPIGSALLKPGLHHRSPIDSSLYRHDVLVQASYAADPPTTIRRCTSR